jgi:hypothetical protein
MATVDVNLKADSLTEEINKFEQRKLDHPLFLNSVPKSGSHLLRNVVRMFVPADQQYYVQFIQPQILHEHFGAFGDQRNFLSWGHLTFTLTASVAVGNVRHILLVRDPYDWVLASARFFVSDQVTSFDLLKEGTLTVDAILNMIILGIPGKTLPLSDLFMHNAIGWFGTGVHVVHYEDLARSATNLESEESDRFFAELLEACGIDRPNDWRERVRIGSDRKYSWTARENLTGPIDFPAALPDTQKRIVDLAAPGLREILGYK